MAKKFKKKTGNCTPPSRTNKLKDLEYSSGDVISGIIRNAWNEVGASGYSSYPGVDPNGVALAAVTFAKRSPNMFRYDLIDDPSINDDDDDGDLADGLISNYFYEKGRRDKKKGKKSVALWEFHCLPDYTYEEEYFQHIFNWPTAHETVPRKIAGLLKEVATPYSTDPESEACIAGDPTITHYPITMNYGSQSLTLEKVVSKIYYIDDNWNYQEITLDSSGNITSSTARDRVGQPIIYHGGTDDKTKLFFHYKIDGTDIATSNVIAIGDQINGIAVTNVVNYVVDVAIKRVVYRHAKKNTEDKEITESEFNSRVSAGKIVGTYAPIKSWLKLNTADGIAIGDTIWGRGIRGGTTVAAVDEERSRVYLTETLSSKKVKGVRFKDQTLNNVSKNTLCYAELASDASFTADANYNVTRNGATVFQITARAGAGIVNRSAIVGIYKSIDKKQIEYEPIFYSSDSNCEKTTFSDSYGEYVLGTAIYTDNSRDEGLYYLTNPASNVVYQISAMHYATMNGPVDRDNLIRWVNDYNRGKPIIQIYSEISNYALSKGKKIAGVLDDVCGDEVNVTYTKVYDAEIEMNLIDENINHTIDGIDDDCLTPVPETPAETIQSAQDRFNEVVQKSLSQSSILSKEYYEKLISNEDSLFNRVNNASNIMGDSVPKNTKIENLPQQVEGQDDSGQRFLVDSFRDMPTATDRVKFYINDVLTGTDRDMNPILDLDPATTHNQPKIIISSIPVWTGASTKTQTFSIGGLPTSVTFNVNISDNAYGGIETITTSYTGPTPASGQVPPGALCDYIQYDYSWMIPEKHRVFKEHKETFAEGGYVTGTNWHVHPDLRDLDNKAFPKGPDEDENDYLKMVGPVYPKTLWAPNISYQRDYHKMFWYRPNEITELIGEAIDNNGNPYLDDPISVKLTKTIKPSDTTIHVQSTSGFLSSGYLMIPKYTKKVYTLETANRGSQFVYCGEEIIYYNSKTDTTFENCTRECFGTSSQFETTIPVNLIESGVRYTISSLGNTNWQEIGAPETVDVGTVFTATDSGTGTGTVTIQGSTDQEIPDPNYIAGVSRPPTLPVISSYEKGHSISQHWIFRRKED